RVGPGAGDRLWQGAPLRARPGSACAGHQLDDGADRGAWGRRRPGGQAAGGRAPARRPRPRGAPHRPRADRPVRRAAYPKSHYGRRERMIITGRPETRKGQDYLVLPRTLAASVDDVWAAITEPERLGRWFGTWTGDPATGQVRVRWDFEEEMADETYAIDACEAPHHLRLHNVNED